MTIILQKTRYIVDEELPPPPTSPPRAVEAAPRRGSGPPITSSLPGSPLPPHTILHDPPLTVVQHTLIGVSTFVLIPQSQLKLKINFRPCISTWYNITLLVHHSWFTSCERAIVFSSFLQATYRAQCFSSNTPVLYWQCIIHKCTGPTV